MEPPNDLPILLEDLEVNIDELSTALHPLLTTPTSKLAQSLPLLDKAKLQILTAYAIESLLFSSLQASAQDAKSHAVFKELARLKGYFGKVKEAERLGSGEGGPKARLDRDAAARFIRHGLAGNERFDLERAERLAKEKARAAVKAQELNIKFDQKEEQQRQVELKRKRKAEEAAGGDDGEDNEKEGEEEDDEKDEEDEEGESEVPEISGLEPSGIRDAEMADTTPPAEALPPASTSTTRQRKKSKKRKHLPTDPTSLSDPTTTSPASSLALRKPRTSHGASSKRSKSHRKALNHGSRPAQNDEELVLPERSAAQMQEQGEVQGQLRTHSETFRALLDGSFAEVHREKEMEKGKGGGSDEVK